MKERAFLLIFFYLLSQYDSQPIKAIDTEVYRVKCDKSGGFSTSYCECYVSRSLIYDETYKDDIDLTLICDVGVEVDFAIKFEYLGPAGLILFDIGQSVTRDKRRVTNTIRTDKPEMQVRLKELYNQNLIAQYQVKLLEKLQEIKSSTEFGQFSNINEDVPCVAKIINSGIANVAKICCVTSNVTYGPVDEWYGYHYWFTNVEGAKAIENTVKHNAYCSSMYIKGATIDWEAEMGWHGVIGGRMKANTEKPTRKPTVSPTMNPTVNPTRRPTENPTQGPSINPTPQPSQSPTFSPSYYPTVVEQTAKPATTKPTISPTSHPTVLTEIQLIKLNETLKLQNNSNIFGIYSSKMRVIEVKTNEYKLVLDHNCSGCLIDESCYGNEKLITGNIIYRTNTSMRNLMDCLRWSFDRSILDEIYSLKLIVSGVHKRWSSSMEYKFIIDPNEIKASGRQGLSELEISFIIVALAIVILVGLGLIVWRIYKCTIVTKEVVKEISSIRISTSNSTRGKNNLKMAL